MYSFHETSGSLIIVESTIRVESGFCMLEIICLRCETCRALKIVEIIQIIFAHVFNNIFPVLNIEYYSKVKTNNTGLFTHLKMSGNKILTIFSTVE